MSYKKHIDSRGVFQELFRNSRIRKFNIKQVSYLKINPKETRGKHYHKKLDECFIILSGEAVSTLEYIDGSTQKVLLKNEEEFCNILLMKPYTKHSFYSEEGCEMIILSSNEFDQENPDTFVDF